MLGYSTCFEVKYRRNRDVPGGGHRKKLGCMWSRVKSTTIGANDTAPGSRDEAVVHSEDLMVSEPDRHLKWVSRLTTSMKLSISEYPYDLSLSLDQSHRRIFEHFGNHIMQGIFNSPFLKLCYCRYLFSSVFG